MSRPAGAWGTAFFSQAVLRPFDRLRACLRLRFPFPISTSLPPLRRGTKVRSLSKPPHSGLAPESPRALRVRRGALAHRHFIPKLPTAQTQTYTKSPAFAGPSRITTAKQHAQIPPRGCTCIWKLCQNLNNVKASAGLGHGFFRRQDSAFGNFPFPLSHFHFSSAPAQGDKGQKRFLKH